MSNKFIYPDYYSQEDNGHILAGYGLASNENLGLITSSDDTYDNFGLITNLSPETPTTDSYGLISSRVVFYLDYGFLYDPILGIEIIYAKENYGELYLTNIVDFGEINLDSNPPSTLNYTTRNVDESEDYGSLRYGLRDPFSIENYGLISQSVTESESYELISTPIYSFGTTSKTTAYGSLSILYPQSPDDYELISSSPTENIDYGLLWISYDEILNYGEVIYRFDETVTPYGSLTIGGGLRESFTPQTAVGSGSISASGVKGEAITDFYGVGSVAIDTSLESSIDFGSVASAATETEDYGLITASVDEVDSYGFLYPVITPFGLFNISGSASNIIFKQTFLGSGSVIESGFIQEKNTDRYTIDSILPGGSPENYGSVGSASTSSEVYGLVNAHIDQAEDYHYIFYPAGETITPYGTFRISGASFDEIRTQFIHEGSGSISASGVKGEAITKFYSVDSTEIDTSIEFSTSYGLISNSIDESEDYGLITASANEVDSYGFLYPVITPFGLFNVSGSAGESFKPATYIGSGSVIESGFVEQKNTDRYSIDSILPGASPEDYGTVNTSATTSDNFGLVTAPIDQTEDYHYIFYPAGETILPYGTIRISGASFDELKIQFVFEGSGSISASGVKGEAITDSYNIDSSVIDTSIEFSINYGLISASVDETTEDYGLIVDSATEVDSYGFLQTLLTSFGVFNITGTAGERFVPTCYIGSGSIDNAGVIEEKNTDRYTIDSILPGSASEDYETVNTSATSSEAFGLVTAPIDQTEDYHYIFYPAGETILPYGTIRISGASFDELKIQFVFEGSGSISASGVKGEAITKFYGVDSIQVDTSIEFSTSYGSIADSIDETEDYGLIIATSDDVDSYGFLYPVITPFGLFNVSGSARESFKPATYIGSGSITNDGILEEKNTDRYTIDSILPGSASEDYGTVNTSATTSESYELITAPIDQTEDYHYIFYPAGETITPYGTFRISGASFDELKIQFVFEGSGSISASGVKGEAITKFYSVDSTEIDTSLESSIDFGSVTSAATETEDYGLITESVTEVDSYGFLYPVITPFGLFNVSGSARESFKPATYIGSGSITNDGILEEKNTDRYTIDSILLGGSPEDYGSVGSASTSSEVYGLVAALIDEVEDYHYVFYPAGETITPYGTFRISGDSFNELRIKFIHEGSGSISANGVAGEAITKFYSVDSIEVDTLIEFSTSYGSIADSIGESEDYGLITASVDEVDSYGFLYPVITPFGLFEISGSASAIFKNGTYIGSGSITNDGILEEKNTDRYTIDSILPGGSPENYGSVGSTTDEPSESYELITAPIDQTEDYHYIFYPAGETITPYGTIRISGDAITELGIQFIHEGSGSIAANGVAGEAITDFYGVDSIVVDTSIEFSTSYGLISNSVDETEDYGLITESVTEVDSYGFLYPVITPFGLFNVSGSASAIFKNGTYIGSGSITNDGILEEKNTDRYTIDSILPGGSPEDYGSVDTSATTDEDYEPVTLPIDQTEDYHYIFYPAGETILPYGTIRISGDAITELGIQFVHEGSGFISASGVKGEAITKFYSVDSIEVDTSIEFSTSYGSVTSSVDESEDYGLITESVTEVDSYGFLYPVITPFGLFEISGSASAIFKNGTYIGSGSITNDGILEERNTDSYNLGSILLGGSPDDYGSIGSASTTNEDYELVTLPIDQAEDYHYIFYTAGEDVYPFGTIRISGDAITELGIQFVHEGSGSIAANGVVGEAITKFYSVDSIQVDTSIEFSTSYGLISNSVDESEDYGLIVDSVTEVDSYGFLYPVITPFGLFNVSGSASNVIFKQAFTGSGSITNDGILEERNTDSYNLGSILLGGSPEDYGSVDTSATTSEDYESIIAPIDQAEDYHYIFYTAGEDVYPFGTIRISGDAFTELGIQFVHEGSGSISANGVAGEAITKFYSVDSIEVDTSIESSIDFGSVASAVTETEDYGLITESVTEVDSYGFLYPVITPFGLFNVSGSASAIFKNGTYIGSGSITNDGILEEKNTDRYTIDSILLGGSPEDYGSVGSASTISEDYELVTLPIDQTEDYHYVLYPAGETIYPYGTIEISGSATTELAIQFIHEGSGSIAANGVAGEAITKFYSVDSIEVDTLIEFSTSYGLVSDSVDETEDYGLITASVDEVDSYGFLYPVITPFGLFNVSGSARESFKPATYIGSGSVIESGVLKERNTDSYNIDSILLGGSPDDYGSVGSASTSSEVYGLVAALIDEVEDYHYIFYTAGEDVYPYGTIRISGDVGKKQRFAYDGSGTINITGYVLIPQRYLGSGTLFAIGGGAEVSGSNPPDQVTPIVISGAATDLKNTYSNVGSGTILISGDAATEIRGETTYQGSGTIEISGTAAESFTPQNYTGSGFLEFSGTKIEKNTDSYNIDSISSTDQPYEDLGILSDSVIYDDFGSVLEYVAPQEYEENGPTLFGGIPPYGTINISGAATDLKNTFSEVGSGSFSSFGGAAEVSGSNPPAGIDIQISGTAAESFIPTTYIGSGSFSSFGGAAEVSGSNPPDQVTPIVISGAATNLKNTYSNVGSGTGVFSGAAVDEFRGLSIYSADGTIVISGTAAESFIPTTYIGSGSFSSFGGAAEVSGSNPPDQTVPIVISGAATNLKNTYSNVGSGTGVFSGAATDLKNTYSNVGSGTGVFSGTAAESFVPATAVGSGTLFAIGGGAEVSGSNPPDQTVPIVISGAATDLKNTYSNVGSGSFSSFGGAAEVSGSNPPDQTVPIVISGTKIEKRRISEVGSGRFSSLGGAADVKGSNPPDQTLIITLSGIARERFIPATAVGSGSISESGAATDLKNTRSEVGVGTVAITGGITPDVQIYVPSFTGSGTLFGIGGAAEVSGSNPPDRFVLFTFSGTAGEAFVPQTAVGSGVIEISGVGVGVSNPYRAPFVYVTII